MLKVFETAVPVACWSCSVAQNESTLFCSHCGKIQPPSGGDFFSVFGLEPRLNLDLAALEREFHRLSRKLHPDRFARASEDEKRWSLADTALLNDAWRALKDPLRRTEYLLKLEAPTELLRNQKKDEEKNLLEEVFDLNLQLEELRAVRKARQEDHELRQSVLAAKQKFECMIETVDRDLRAQWAIWDAGNAAERKTAESTMAALLERRRYLSNLLRDVNAVLEA